LEKREQYTKQHISILKKIVEGYFSKAKASLGLQYTQRWLELDTYDEEAHRYLLQFFALKGDYISAKNHFSQLTQMLDTELDVAPEQLTVECFDKVSLSYSNHTDTQATKPRSLVQSYNKLPYKADEFVGRDQDIKALETIFDKQSLITLYAWGGVGKTRLAIAFAEQYQHQFKNGVLYVSLVNQRYDRALDYFREALNLESSVASDIIEDLKHFFSEQHLLLIIDNAEEYVEELVVLNQLLEVSPHLKILVTSRVTLGLQTEYKYDLEGLSLPDSEANLKQSECYTLLEKRMARSGVSNNFDDAMLLQLFQLSEGMPLVLEMMATWLAVLPADRLNTIQDLYVLEHPLQDVADRHKTIERCFEYSWSLLSQESQNLAAAASIFHTDYSFSELQAVTGATTKNIFTVTHSSFLTHNADGSFMQHPLVKYFCNQKLKAINKFYRKTQEKYTTHYLNVVQDLRDVFVENQSFLDNYINIDNIWDVACILSSQGKSVRLAHFISVLSAYNIFNNDFVRGRDQLDHLLKLIEKENYNLPQELTTKLVRAMIYVWLIYFNTFMGQIDKSQSLLDKHAKYLRTTFAVLETLDYNAGMFYRNLLQYTVADLLNLKADYLKSNEVLDGMLKQRFVEPSEMTSLRISARTLQSYNQMFLGDYSGAIASLQENIDRPDDFVLRPLSYSNLSKVYFILGQTDTANYYLNKAQKDAEAFNLKFLTYEIYFVKAQALILERRFEEAQALIENTNTEFYKHLSKRNRYDYRYVYRHFLAQASLYDAQNDKALLEVFAKQALAEAECNEHSLVQLMALYFCGRAESTKKPQQAKERFEYVYQHPKTTYEFRQLAGLELEKLSDTTVDLSNQNLNSVSPKRLQIR